MPSAARRREVERLLEQSVAWAEARDDVVALALVGSWARGDAHAGSDIDLIVLTSAPAAYAERDDWMDALAPGATLAQTAEWGPIVERRLLLPSGLDVEVGIGRPSWADASPVDPGTRRVVREGLRVLYDPHGLLARLAAACR